MESDLHLVHFRFLQRGSGAKNSKLPENIWPTPGYSPGFSPAFSGRMRKILGFLRTVKHPPGLEQAVPGVSTGRSRIKVRRSINVFGCIALGAELQLTRGEFVRCPGIETHARLDDPKSDRGQRSLLKKQQRHFPMAACRNCRVPLTVLCFLPALCRPTASSTSHSLQTVPTTDHDLPQVWISGNISARSFRHWRIL